jgi:transposase
MKKYKIFVGIDISKGWIDVAVKSETVSVCRRFDNCKKGYRSMLSWLKTFASFKEMILCMEHTGVYGMPLWEYLANQKICFVVETGLQIRHSMGIRRGKSDKADAQIIARYIRLHHTETRLYKVPNEVIKRLKIVFGYRERLLKVKHLLTVSSKEISSFMSKSACREMTIDSGKLAAIISERISRIEKVIDKIIEADPETNRIYRLVKSVPGIGPITGAYLIIVTQNFTLINNSRKLSRYAGMSPEKNESGIIKRKAKTSRIGNKKLKALLSNCVGTIIQHDIESREYQQRKIDQGKPEGVIINNLRNKILHRVCAVVNRGTPYVNIKKYRTMENVA